MARKKEEFDWIDDPFDSKKQQQVEEEIRNARRNTGCVAGVTLFIMAFILAGASFFIGMGVLLMVALFLAGMGVGFGLCSLLTRS